MMATGASTAIAHDSPALKDGEALREPERSRKSSLVSVVGVSDLGPAVHAGRGSDG
jgi:hypothetical protein